MIEKIGVIKKVWCGLGGYQDVQVAFAFEVGGQGWGTIVTFEGGWGHVSKEEVEKPGSNYKWTHEDRIKQIGEAWWKVINIMKEAKVKDISELKGKPVKVFFESECGRNQGFEILADAIL